VHVAWVWYVGRWKKCGTLAIEKVRKKIEGNEMYKYSKDIPNILSWYVLLLPRITTTQRYTNFELLHLLLSYPRGFNPPNTRPHQMEKLR